MTLSTATTKSICLTLALSALTTSVSALETSLAAAKSCGMADYCGESSSTSSDNNELFESATMLGPIHLPSLATHSEDDDVHRNASVYYSDSRDGEMSSAHDDEDIVEEEEYELPAELASLIASAEHSKPSAPTAAPSLGSQVRYYATYSEGESCSSKNVNKFDAWETSYETLEECCEMEFSWDYDSCVSSL